MKGFFKSIWLKLRGSTVAGRVLVILIVLAALAVAMILSGPKPPNDFNPLATPTAVRITPNATGTIILPTSIPSSEYKLTNGVVLAVVTVVLIILIGTIVYLRKNRETNQ